MHVIERLPSVRRAPSAESVVTLLGQLLPLMGADSGMFLSLIADDAMRTSIRSLLACDERWAVEYSRQGWHGKDPWLRYALESQTPIRSSELHLHAWEADFNARSTELGFASALVIPAPSSFGAARVGVLVLGSSTPGHFDTADHLVLIVARALAMELHEWLLRTIREDLVERSGITPDQVDLLRREASGHTSKMIAADLRIKPKAVDRRFQRAMERLDAPDRKTAVRIARLYGLI
ncbi:helix-turn-helix transcriptional regulator [Roseateles cellulosilyticus]|uniref:Autoinducer binding domain-containing protein n=1 Tax=Pelomonas cellulosilytica TaxID=2906762 RepID=A0ABS8XZG7_9BURK|nr:autoinducer binding domain-containing protein [Pelomonas sp. P8]MCE4558009.1 autoinducer binding domain-containing protein [Pelomonas sp. P8]